MSLINDALKRATKAPAATESAAGLGEPMRPTDSHRSVALPRYFFPILLCILCGAMWFIVQGWEARRQAALETDLVRVHAREAGSTDPAPAAASTADIALATETPVGPASDDPPIPANRNFSLDDDIEPGAAVAPPPAPPALRLQGIFYRASSPSALVNAQTVFVGDQVAGARIKAIDRGSVTLERDGRIQVLTLR